MLDKNILKQSLSFSAGAVIYIVIIATIMSNAEKIFGPGPDTVLAPIVVLLLFVTSAAVMGMLVFGKPVMLYFDGKKREAVTMAIYTTACLASFTALILIAIGLFHGPAIM